MTKREIAPVRALSGLIEVPGDKSISHRYAILAALAEGRSEIRNFSSAADCHSSLDCLRRLGIRVEEGKEAVAITGVGLDGLSAPRSPLDAQNSGTTMRLLAGVLAGQTFGSTLTGDNSLRRRPMRRVIKPLRQMGAAIRAREDDFAPLEIRGARLHPIDHTPRVPSAQVKSAILLAGLYADGVTVVEEPVVTRDHLEVALAEFGAQVERQDGRIRVHGRPRLVARNLVVPGDLSAAVFFVAAALIVPGAELVIRNLGLNPTRTGVLDFLVSMGAPISIVSVAMRDGELVGNLAVRQGQLEGGTIAGAAVAKMIDELPMLAALGPYTKQGIEIRDARELRVKESDRISALAENLRRMGAEIEELPDGLRVAGRAAGRLRGAEIDPHGDHRIAMAFSIAALGADGETTIQDPDCAAVSFPDFFNLLEHVVER